MSHYLASGTDIFNSLGGVLGGLAELFGVIGSAIGFLIRGRRNKRRDQLRTERAAQLAAQEAKKQLEAKLDKQYNDRLAQFQTQISDSNAAHESEKEDLTNSYTLQIEQYKQQVRDLTRDREALLNRLLNLNTKDPGEPNNG